MLCGVKSTEEKYILSAKSAPSSACSGLKRRERECGYQPPSTGVALSSVLLPLLTLGTLDSAVSAGLKLGGAAGWRVAESGYVCGGLGHHISANSLAASGGGGNGQLAAAANGGGWHQSAAGWRQCGRKADG